MWPAGTIPTVKVFSRSHLSSSWPSSRTGFPRPSRIAFVEVAHRLGGVESAKTVARKRGGKQFDPMLTKAMCEDAELILSGLDSVGTWEAVVDAEPALGIVL